MTQNQSNQIVKNPNTKKAMAVLAKYAELESQLKTVEKEAKEATELIKNAMIEANVPRIEINLPEITGYITLAERINYKDEGAIEDVLNEVLHFLATHKSTDTVELENKLQYLKLVLDTDKVKAQRTLTGQLPAGVVESKTQYITKKFKAAE